VVLLILGGFLLFHFLSHPAGREVVIEQGNELVGIYPLAEGRVIEVQGPLGISTVVISDGLVYMEDSPCPHKVCIHMGKIHEKNDTIVCIPNRVYITIK
jgi:hypothetical protein